MNLIRLLWRGEIPLWKTYWVYGVLGGLVVQGVVLALSYNSLRFINRPGGGLVLLVVNILAIAYSGLMLGSIWRSAGNYMGPRSNAVLARVAVVLGSLTLARAVLAFFYPAAVVTESSLVDEAVAINVQLPHVLNDDLRLDRVTASGMGLTYDYTLVKGQASEFDASEVAKLVNVIGICGGRMKGYLDAGVVLTYRYSGSDGVVVASKTVNRQACLDGGR